MLKRVVISLAILAVLLTLAAVSPAVLPSQQAAAQGGGTDQAAWIVVIGADGTPQVFRAQAQGPGVFAVLNAPAAGMSTVNPDLALLPATGNEDAAQAPSANPILANMSSTTPAIQSLLNDMTFVWLQDEDYARVVTACAGTGLRNVAPFVNGPIVLIPNAGDLDLAGSAVALKVYPDGQVEFIPRHQGQLIRVPVDIGTKAAGQEVLSLSLNEGLQLLASGQMTWTANNQGPFGNGHGLPGHLATCDPRYPGDEAYADYLETGRLEQRTQNDDLADRDGNDRGDDDDND